jgi:hypothetical protein
VPIILISVTIAIVLWAHALVRRGRPVWVRWIGIGCAMTTAIASAIALYQLYRAHRSLEMQESANKATEMAKSIAIALNVVAGGTTCAIVAIVVLVYFTLRKPKRQSSSDHSPARPPGNAPV